MNPIRESDIDLRDSAWLLLHGLGDLPDRFEPLATLLRERGATTYAPNLSYGYAACEPRNFDTLAQKVARDFVALHGDRARRFIIGHSMGAQIAICAVDNIDPLDGLVVIEGSLNRHDTEAVGRYLDDPSNRVSGRDRLIERLLDAAPNDPIAVAYVEALRSTAPETFGQMARETVERQAGLALQFKRLSVPRVYLVGEQSTGTRANWAREAGASLSVLPDAGHWAHVDQTNNCFRLVTSFSLYRQTSP